MRRRTRLCIVVLGLAGLATAVRAAESVQKFPAARGGKLVLDLEAGATVKIEGSGGAGVEVAHSDECTPPCEVLFEEGHDGLTIHTKFTKGDRSQSSDVELSIKVPARFDVEVNSIGGEISIDGVEGKFTGKTNGGDLTLRRVRGEAEFATMGGDIQLSDSELDGSLKTMGGEVTFENVVGDVHGSSMGGNVRYRNVRSRGGRLASPERTGEGIDEVNPDTVQISSMGGDIEVEEASEGADLHTMGGDIEVHRARRFVRAKTMGGNIDIESVDGWVEATSMGGDVEAHVTGDGGKVILTSHSGRIELTVPAGFGMDLDLEIAFTRNSNQDFKIVAPEGLKPTVTSEWDHAHGSPRKYIRMEGKVNGGGQPVKVRTVNGDIVLKEGD